MREVFCGIHLDDKPTGVPDGSEFIEVDTKDIYVFYNGTWYKQKDKVLSKLEEKEITITDNESKAYLPSEGKIGFSKVTITTNVQSGANLSDYFNNIITYNGSTNAVSSGTLGLVKKFNSPINLSVTNIDYLFSKFWGLVEVPTVIAQNNITSMSYTFGSCEGLTEIPNFIDTSHVTNMYGCFNYCTNLETLGNFDTSSVDDFRNCFNHCEKLKNFPVLDMSSATKLDSMFNDCSSFTDTSLDNMLQSLISATSYTGTKTLYALALRSTDYSASKIQSLPHYQDFLDAGWTIGY